MITSLYRIYHRDILFFETDTATALFGLAICLFYRGPQAAYGDPVIRVGHVPCVFVYMQKR